MSLSLQGSCVVPQRRMRWRMFFAGLGVIAAAIAIRYYWSTASANAAPAAKPAAKTLSRPAAQQSQPAKGTAANPTKTAAPEIVAVVNGKQVKRDALGRECLRHYGKEVLESLVNKHLISQECQRRKIVITEADVDAEIKRIAQRFSLPTDQWLKMLKQERGIKPAQYASDIIWPTLALRRLAGEKLTVTQEELEKAFETQYGAAVAPG